MLCMRERRTQAAERTRERPRHAHLLRARREAERLGPIWDELGMARHRDEPDAGLGRERAELAEEIERVCLVARPMPAEDVRIEDDDAHASSRQSSTTMSAARSQVYSLARATPAGTSSPR